MKFYKDILNQDIFKYLLSQGGVSFLFRIIGMVLSFINIWIISNFYNVETYGIFSLIQTVLLITLAVFTLGVQNVLIIEINKKDNLEESYPEDFLLKTMKLVLVISAFPILVFYFGSDLLSNLFNNKQLALHFQFLAIFFPFLLLHEIFLYYYIALKKFIKFGFFMFFFPNVMFTLLILFFHDKLNEDLHITIFYSLSFVLTFLIEFILVFGKLSFKKINTEKLTSYKKIMEVSVPMMFSGLMILLLNWTDVLMLGIMTTEKEVGIYNAAFKFGFLVLLVTSTFNVVLVPKISEMYQLGDIQSLKRMINKATQLVVVLTIPIVIVLLFFGKNLLSFFGQDFISGYTVLIIITMSSFFSSICGNVDQILNMTNNQNVLMRVNIIALLFNIVLNYFLILNFGIIGAAISSLVSTIFLNGYCVFFIKKNLGFYTLF